MKAALLPMLLVVLVAAIPGAAAAQVAPTTGVITGTVRNGTAGASPPNVQVQLIAVPRVGPISAQQAMTVDGRFRFEARADASLTYLLRTEHAGVPYLDEMPLLISPELPTVHRDLVVWETTSERPPLRIEQTTVSVSAVDRAEGRLELQREDRVVNDGDRVWVGGADRATLRIPGPDKLEGVEVQQAYDGELGVDGQTVTSTRPVRPGVTTFVSRMAVGYDPAADGYRLRVTAPLATEAMELWVPERFANDIEADDARSSTEERDGERWRVIRRTGTIREGESLVASFEGLSGRQPESPFTTPRGAAAATLVALTALVGGVALALRLQARSRLVKPVAVA